MVNFELKNIINTNVTTSTVDGIDYITVKGTVIVGVVGIPYESGNEKYIGFTNDRNLVTSTSLKTDSGVEIDNAFLAACAAFVIANYPTIQ